MDNSSSNTEFDFDLSFLNHTPKNIAPVNVYEKQKKAISTVKKKTVATDTLIRRYYEKKESLEEADRALLASKEECKQLCIDYKNVSERLLQLENEKHTFSKHYQDLEEKCINAQNQFGALQSHCNQLQLLVKENESTIDTLKLENKLEKTTIAKGKSQITRLLRKNKLLQKNIALLKDVVIGKKKVTDEHRAIYNVVGNKGHVSEDSDSGSEHTRIEICEWNEVSDSPGSPDGTQKNAEVMITKEAFSDIKSGIKHKESDDVTSVDTGRGSSLAFSDSEKCFQSPDYYMIDSPTNIERNRLKSVATSPVHIHYISASTSPIHLSNDDVIDIDIKDGEKHCLSDQEKCVAVENPKKTVDRAVSPIQYTEPKTKATDIATSPIFFEILPAEEATPNSNIHHETKTKNTFVPITIDQAVDVECPRTITRSENYTTHSPPILSPFKGFSREEINNVITSVNISKKYCLEINNSNNLSDEDTSDYEIETIFGDMRLKDKMITPIPVTPVQPRKIKKPKNRKTEKDKGLPIIIENDENIIQSQPKKEQAYPIIEDRKNVIQSQPGKDERHLILENRQNAIQNQARNDKGHPKIENVQIIQSSPGKDQRHFIIENRQNTIQKQPCKDKGLPIKTENIQNVIQNQPEKDKGRLIIENVQIIRSPPRKDQRHIIIENPQNTIQKHQGKDKGLPVIIENNQNIIQSQPEKDQCHPLLENRQNAIQSHLGTDQRHFIIENRQNTIQKQPGKDRGHPIIENVQVIQSQPGKDKGGRIIENIQGLPIIIEKNENIIDVKMSEENKILHESIAHLAKEIMSIKDLLQNKFAPEANHAFYTQGNINAHDFLCQPQTLTVQPGNYSSIEFEPLQGFDAPIETCNIPQEEAPFYDDGNDMEQPEEGFDLEPPIETCNITQPTDDINDVEHPEENLDLDPPIETCNITQPIDTLDICPPLSLNPKLSSELSKETTDIKENRETSESKSNTVLNRLHFENMVCSTNSLEDSNIVQSNSRTASPDIIRCSYEDLNDSKTQQSTSPDAINVTLPDIINEKTPQKDGNKTKVKLRKLTRLQKMRKKLIPKSKIKNAVSPLKKSPRLSLTKISIKPEKKVITEQDNAATLNSKDVYEKALKVMAELKSQKNNNRPKNNKFNKRIKNTENSSMDLKSDKELTPKTIPEICKGNNVEVSPPANNEINISRNRKYSLELRSDKELTTITSPGKCKLNNVEVSPPANNEINISRNRKYSLELRSDKELTTITSPGKCKLNNVEVSPPANNELYISKNRKYSLELRSDTELTAITAPEKCKVNNVEVSPPTNNELNISRNRKYSCDLRSDKELTPTTAPAKCKVNNVGVFPPANNNELNFSRNRKYSRVLRCDKEFTPLTAPEKCKVNKVEVFPSANNNKLNFSRNRKYSLELRSDKESTPEATPEKCNNNVETSPPANNNESNISKRRKSRITSQTNINCSDLEIRKSRKRSAALDPELGVENKRILRSSLRLSQSESSVTVPVKTEIIDLKPCVIKISKDILLPGNGYTMHQNIPIKSEKVAEHTKIYKPQNKKEDAIIEQTRCSHPKDSLLCCVIEKFASSKGRQPPKKCKESITNNVCNTIETGITHIIELTSEDRKPAMKKLADELSRWQLNNFLSGLMKYFKNPERKTEMFNKVTCFPAPSMTKSEQILLYVLNILQCSNPWKENVIFKVLNAMEFTMFQLNNTPEFDVIESMSHFYAVLCRFTKSKSRLRLFMLDAMYCIQFKAIPLIRQCMDVWMHILPLGHMAAAKSTLVTCLVYLLHFYKCEDRMKRVSEIRIILQKKYFFHITEWNDIKIMEMFRKSIIQLKDISVEKKMLRMALIILAKRMGPKWCQQNIIKNLLIPTIENPNTPHKAKEFCVSMLGPIMRPYPTDMKIHCEIVINLLLDMLNQNPTPRMEEAIFTSLLYIQHRSFNRIIQELLGWNPSHVSPEFEELLKDFVKSKPIKLWKSLLSKVPLN